MNHGITLRQQGTALSIPSVAKSGIPFIVGTAPSQSAKTPANAAEPALCTSWDEAVSKLGYSDDWEKYSLCEAMYSHFKLYGMQPAIFCNMLDTTKMSEPKESTMLPVADNRALLPLETLDDSALEVRETIGVGEPLQRGADYEVFYSGEHLVVELLPEGTAYGARALAASYRAATPQSVTANVVAAGMENVERCMTSTGLVPDLLLAPGHSGDPVVGAVMATKADGINTVFRAKALIDISTSAQGGAGTYTDAIALKAANNFVDPNQILCWPKLRLGGYQFHMSTQIAGLIAAVDSLNSGVPYESPSNKAFKANGMALEGGSEVNLSQAQANVLNASGIKTGLNFMGGWVAWGNYTACYPSNTDVKDIFVPVSRMFDWVGNTVVRTFWARLDKPMTRRLIGNIEDTCNIWLNGLVGAGYLLGARVEVRGSDNPLTNLLAGIISVRIFIAPPVPAQEIEFTLEFDVKYLESALA